MYTLKFSNGCLDIDVSTGRPRYITGIEKASQDVAYTLLQQYDPVRQIGSRLYELEDAAKNAYLIPGLQNSYVRQYVEDSIQRLQSLQQLDASLTPNAERIEGIERLDVYSGPAPTDTSFYVLVNTRDADQIQKGFKIQLGHQLPPGVAAPPGTDDFVPRGAR